MDESGYDWALFESGGTNNGVYPLVLHVNSEGWLARVGVGCLRPRVGDIDGFTAADDRSANLCGNTEDVRC